MAAEHILQVHTLIYMVAHDWSKVLGGKTLPHLRVLELTGWDTPTSSDNAYTSQCSVVAPALQKLTLHDVLFPVHAPILRYLELFFTLDCELERIPSAHLLSLLSRTPLLEELALTRSIKMDNPAGSPSEGTASREIVLIHLQKFLYVDNIGSSPTFWQFVRAPQDLSVHIDVAGPQVRANLPAFYTILAQQLTAPEYDCLSIKEYRDSYKTGFAINLWVSSKPLIRDTRQDDDLKPSGILVYAFEDEDDNEIIPDAFNTLRVLMTLTPHLQARNFVRLDISDFYIDERPPPFQDSDPRPEVLAPFINVATVSLNADFGHVRFLGESICIGALFSALRHLVIGDLTMNENHDDEDGSKVDGFKETWKILNHLLQTRMQLGHPIKTLKLVGCGSHYIEEIHKYESARNLAYAPDADLRPYAASFVEKVEDIRGH